MAQDTEVAPGPSAASIGMYVGIGGATNLNSTGGGFGYHLEAAVGLSIHRFSFEVLAGTGALNTDAGELSGGHVGGAMRVELVSREAFGLQLGAGLRRHAWRVPQARNVYPLGVLGSVRVHAPLNDYARVYFDLEYERVRSTTVTQRTHVVALGFGLTTHFEIRE